MLQRLQDTAKQLIGGHSEDITNILPNLTIFRQQQDGLFSGIVYQPLFCVVLNGRKEFQLEDKAVRIKTGDAFVISHDMPLASRISDASPAAPYLATILTLDLSILRSLYEQVGSELKEETQARFLSTGSFSRDWAEPLQRYLGLTNDSLKAAVLGPLILQELHFQLLMSSMGGMLRNLLFVDSHASRVAKAIQRIRERFHERLAVAELARVAGMSTSSFHESFKSVTGKTPLQYQKDLRLIAARDLLMTGAWTVSSAALEVGYESPSHFSRDYGRKHGCSPKHHLAHFRRVEERS